MSIDEMMFYGGIAVTIAALVLGVICFLVLKIKRIKLNAQFDAEYGPEIGTGGHQTSRVGIKENR